jgi:hypothetical protein
MHLQGQLFLVASKLSGTRLNYSLLLNIEHNEPLDIFYNGLTEESPFYLDTVAGIFLGT